MRIVISHFHLQTGGVTRVIEHASAALTTADHKVLVIAGEPPQGGLPAGVAFACVPALAYEERRPAMGPRELANALERTARDGLGDLPDLWHFHNHCLGKNLAVPGALISLAENGQRLLLQPHDFAEDGRPALYARLLEQIGDSDAARLSTLLYPQAGQIQYAVLNDRDRGFLNAAGIPAERLHLLPNAVNLPAQCERSAGPFPNRRLWLYPTRAIRRKNLGELLLWASVAKEGDLFAATQAPQNPSEQPRYQRWAALVRELGLPVELELGNRVNDFPALLASAHALITTSVAEGFGLAFLEPWLVGRPLVGRDLPEITGDFTTAGLDLGGLYQRLNIPLDWLNRDRLRAAMKQALGEVMAAYRRTETPADLERMWNNAVQNGHVDFGRLDETAQEEVIRHLAANRQDRFSLNPPDLVGALDPNLVRSNLEVAQRDYSIAGYGRRLQEIYQSLLDAPIDSELGAADGAALLDQFLAPERLLLLRT